MSQHDFNIDNQTAPAFRSDLNNALEALGTLSSGATAPSTTFANMIWYDTAANILKMRSENDDAWINVGYLCQSTNKFCILDDTNVVTTGGTQAGLLGDQATSAWEAGTSTTESLVSPAKVASAIATLGVSGLASTQVFTSSGTWTKPSGVTKALVFVTGGGGGGAVFSAGRGAGTAISLRDVSSISSVTVTIGSGGSGSTSVGGAGSDSEWVEGGNTIVGAGAPTSSGGGGGTSSGGILNMQPGTGTFWGSTYGSPGEAGEEQDEGPDTPGASGGDGVVWVLEFK